MCRGFQEDDKDLVVVSGQMLFDTMGLPRPSNEV
jgi:hypothetical protein